MKLLSYVIDRDFGFAPNPFHGYCTLATCKPKTRSVANVGDWILGIGGRNLKKGYKKLIFAMKVTEKLTFNEYWIDERFQDKKPLLNGSLMQAYGDNIYFYNGSQWIQADSHHSYENGLVNEKNLNKDTSCQYVLISKYFYYFGTEFKDIPQMLDEYIVKGGSNHRRVDNISIINNFSEWLDEHFNKNYLYGFPYHFREFKRYNGES